MRKLLFVVLSALVAVFLFMPSGQAEKTKNTVINLGPESHGVPATDLVKNVFLTPQKKPSSPAAATHPEEDDSDDPDLPPGLSGKIDKEAYLRARADYIDLLRGRTGEVPVDARDNAIRQMNAQETNVLRKVED